MRLNWTGDPITIYVYAGAHGGFDLYEDQGTTYHYEHGAFATIPLRWNDGARTLSLGARSGSFPGMLTARTFQVILASPANPVGFTFSPSAGKTVSDDGAAMDVAF